MKTPLIDCTRGAYSFKLLKTILLLTLFASSAHAQGEEVKPRKKYHFSPPPKYPDGQADYNKRHYKHYSSKDFPLVA